MNCPICGKIEAFEEDYDICETCGWEEDPFMSVFNMNVQFIDCDGNTIKGPKKFGSPNHCDSVADARISWNKYKTWGHFDKNNEPEPWALARHEAIKKRGFEDHAGSSPDNPKTFTKKETDQVFKKIFGKNFKESE